MSQSPQDFLTDSLFSPAPNDISEVLTFLQSKGVTLTAEQIQGITLLRHLGGFDSIIDSVLEARSMAMPTQKYEKAIDRMAKAQAAASNPQMVGVLAEGGKKK